jgi:anti-sigma B factor antagonist
MASLDNFPVRWIGRQAIVTLPREIDISNADAVTDLLLAVLNQNALVLVADMTATSFCACAGVNALARAHVRADANRTQLRVAARAAIVRRIFALTGLDRLLPVFDTVPAALVCPETTPEARRPGDEDPQQRAAVP